MVGEENNCIGGQLVGSQHCTGQSSLKSNRPSYRFRVAKNIDQKREVLLVERESKGRGLDAMTVSGLIIILRRNEVLEA